MVRPRLIVFGDDWARHPSTIQHLIRGLLGQYDVAWVNTIGTRRPHLTLADLRRGIEKVSTWIGQSRRVPHRQPDAPRVYSPIHWPSFHRSWERRRNRGL